MDGQRLSNRRHWWKTPRILSTEAISRVKCCASGTGRTAQLGIPSQDSPQSRRLAGHRAWARAPATPGPAIGFTPSAEAEH
jgi:hypothetical protein